MTNSFVLTKGPLNAGGRYDLYLDAWQGKNYIGRMTVESGIAGRQNFRTVPDEKVGALEPVPEGEYDLGGLDWAGGAGNYTKKYKEIDSPIWVTVYRRRNIGFHLDGNRSYSPGSAGCPVFKTVADMKRFVNWWNGYGGFQKMYVDWGLGYVKVPAHLRVPSAAPKAPTPQTPGCEYHSLTPTLAHYPNGETDEAFLRGNDLYVLARGLRRLGIGVQFHSAEKGADLK